MQDTDIIAVTVPIRLRASHGIDTRGFASESRGFLARHDTVTNSLVPGFSARDLVILDLTLEEFTISPAMGEEQTLRLRFAEAQTLERIDRFLVELANGLSASLAAGQKDAWHGNLYIEIRATVLVPEYLRTERADVVRVTDSMQLTRHQSVPITVDRLERLQASPFTEIFADGVRAAQPKSKYIYWFVLLEELEKRDEFRLLYNQLYSGEEIEAILEKSGFEDGKLNRLKQFLRQPQLTAEPRYDKLALILKTIGATSVSTIKGDVDVTPKLCKDLIGQRNKVAHRGSQINEFQMFSVLMPLALKALDYLNAAAGEESGSTAAAKS
jgi:hypothetical protein